MEYQDSSSNQASYSKLQANGGVDFSALRLKYTEKSASAGTAQANISRNCSSSNNPPKHNYTKEEIKNTNDKLNKYQMCSACQGQGTVKIMYNHISKTVNCEVCDGEAILLEKAVTTMTSQLNTDVGSAVDTAPQR